MILISRYTAKIRSNQNFETRREIAEKKVINLLQMCSLEKKKQTRNPGWTPYKTHRTRAAGHTRLMCFVPKILVRLIIGLFPVERVSTDSMHCLLMMARKQRRQPGRRGVHSTSSSNMQAAHEDL